MRLGAKAYEIVAEDLRRQIESGVLKPGEKLETIEALGRTFQVGRSTIREALGHLKAQGLVASVQGGGTYVTENAMNQFAASGMAWLAQADELKQLLQVRQILEIGAIQLAAVNRTEIDVANLSRIIEQMRNTIGNEEISLRHDVNFHLAIVTASHNTLLSRLMDSLSTTMVRTMRDSRKLWLYSGSASAAHLFEEHERMYLAIEEQDADLAGTVMKQHLHRVMAAFG